MVVGWTPVLTRLICQGAQWPDHLVRLSLASEDTVQVSAKMAEPFRILSSRDWGLLLLDVPVRAGAAGAWGRWL